MNEATGAPERRSPFLSRIASDVSSGARRGDHGTGAMVVMGNGIHSRHGPKLCLMLSQPALAMQVAVRTTTSTRASRRSNTFMLCSVDLSDGQADHGHARDRQPGNWR